MLPYIEPDYARTRLIETIVMYKGRPVTVADVALNGDCTVRYLTDREYFVCQLGELDINPVPLGYLNTMKFATYLTRIPMRQDWRQGLRNRTMRHNHADAQDPPANKFLEACILGQYPSLGDCFSIFRRRVATVSVAFSRNFAVLQNATLQYKGRWIVGDINPKGNYNLLPKFDWVRENLEEDLAV